MFNGLFKRKPTPSPTAATEVSAIDSKRFPKSKRRSPVAPPSTSAPAATNEPRATHASASETSPPRVHGNSQEPVSFSYNKDPEAAPAPSYEQSNHAALPQSTSAQAYSGTVGVGGAAPDATVGATATGGAVSAMEYVGTHVTVRVSSGGTRTVAPQGGVERPPAYDEVIDEHAAMRQDSLGETHSAGWYMMQTQAPHAPGSSADVQAHVSAGHDAYSNESTLFHVPEARNSGGYTPAPAHTHAHTRSSQHTYSTHTPHFSSQPSPYPTPYPAYLTPFARDARTPQCTPYPDTPAQQPQTASSASVASVASASSSSLASSHQHPQLHARSYPLFTPHTPQMPHTPYTPPSLQHMQPHTYSHHPAPHPAASHTTHMHHLHPPSSSSAPAHTHTPHTQAPHTHVQHTAEYQYPPRPTPQHHGTAAYSCAPQRHSPPQTDHVGYQEHTGQPPEHTPAYAMHTGPHPHPHPHRTAANSASLAGPAAAAYATSPAPADTYTHQLPHGSTPQTQAVGYTQAHHVPVHLSSHATHHSTAHTPHTHTHHQGRDLATQRRLSRGDVAHQAYDSGDTRGYAQQKPHYAPSVPPGPPSSFPLPPAPHRIGHGPPRLPPHGLAPPHGARDTRRERRPPGPPLLPRLPRLAPLQGLAQGLGQLLNMGGGRREERAERKTRERAEREAAKLEKRERKDRERQERRERREARRGRGSTPSSQYTGAPSSGPPPAYSHESGGYPADYDAEHNAARASTYDTAYDAAHDAAYRTYGASAGMHTHASADTRNPELSAADSPPSSTSSTSSTASTASTASSGMSAGAASAPTSAMAAGLAAACFPSPSALQYSRLTATSGDGHSASTQPRLSREAALRGVPVPTASGSSVSVQTGIAHASPQQTLSELALAVPSVDESMPLHQGTHGSVKVDTREDPELGKTVSAHSPQWERLSASAADAVEVASPLSPTGTVTAQSHTYSGVAAPAASLGAASLGAASLGTASAQCLHLHAQMVPSAVAAAADVPSAPEFASAAASEGLYSVLPAADIAGDLSFSAEDDVEDDDEAHARGEVGVDADKSQEGDYHHNNCGDAPSAIALWRVESMRESRDPLHPIRAMALHESIATQENGLMTPEADLFPDPTSLLHTHGHVGAYAQDEWVLAASNTALYAGVPVLPDDIFPVHGHGETHGGTYDAVSVPPTMPSVCLPSPSTFALPHSLASGLSQAVTGGSFAQALHSSAGDAYTHTSARQLGVPKVDIRADTTGMGGLAPAYVTERGLNWEAASVPVAAERRPVDAMHVGVLALHMEHRQADVHDAVESPLQVVCLRARDTKANDIGEGDDYDERDDSAGSTQDSEEGGRSDATSFSFFTSPPSTSPTSSAPSSSPSTSTPAPTQALVRAASQQAPSPNHR